jgi:hypothetical protein
MGLQLTAFLQSSLQIGARRHRTYIFREGLLAAMLIALFSAVSAMATVTGPGRVLMSQIVYISAAFCLLAGPFYFSSALIEEREAATLGLLKMTGLGSTGIVLGKWLGRLSGAASLLIAQVPFTVLAVTLGGVAVPHVLLAYLGLLSYLFLVCSVGLFYSAAAATRSAAAVATVCTFAVLSLGTVGFMSLSAGGTPAPAAAGSLSAFALACASATTSVFVAVAKMVATGGTTRLVTLQVAADCALGAAFLLLAVLVFGLTARQVHETSPEQVGSSGRRWPLERAWIGRVWPNALAWKDFYFLAGGKAFLIVRLLVIAFGLLAVVAVTDWDSRAAVRGVGAGAMVVGLAMAAAELVIQHARMFSAELRSASAAQLLTLPMPTVAIYRDKLMGCLPGLIPAVLCVVAGAGIAPDMFVAGALRALSRPFSLAFILADVALLAELALLASVTVRRGSFLLAAGAWFFGNAMFGWPVLVSFELPPFEIVSAVLAAGCAVLAIGALRGAEERFALRASQD